MTVVDASVACECGQDHPRCSAHNNRGGPCGGMPLNGARTCRVHTPNPKARSKAAVRYAVTQWTPGMQLEDPGEVMLRMVTIAWKRWTEIAAELTAKVDEAGSIEAAMTATSYGEGGRTGEYIKGLALLEAEWSKRAMEWSAAAVKAGLDERRVRMAEQLGSSLISLLDGVVAGLAALFGFSATDPKVRQLVEGQLREIDGGKSA